MKEKTDELHERYYQKFWRLQKNAEALSGGVIDVMRQNILNEYKDEYAIMHSEDMIEVERALHSLLVKSDLLTPKKLRFRLFWKRPNRAEDQLNREMYAIAEQFFEKKERIISMLMAALDRADGADQSDTYNRPESGTSDGDDDPPSQAEQSATSADERKAKARQQSGQVPGQMTMDELANDQGTNEETAQDNQTGEQPGPDNTNHPGDSTSSAISKKD